MNPFSARLVMQRMATLFPLGYEGQLPLFTQKGGAVWVQQKYAMSQATFPACHLEAGMQIHSRNSQRTHIAQLQVIISVYARWDQQPQMIDALREDLDSDVELLLAILQDNENLAYGGQAMATSIPRYSISPYRGEIDETMVGLKAVYRTLTATVNVLPYD